MHVWQHQHHAQVVVDDDDTHMVRFARALALDLRNKGNRFCSSQSVRSGPFPKPVATSFSRSRICLVSRPCNVARQQASQPAHEAKLSLSPLLAGLEGQQQPRHTRCRLHSARPILRRRSFHCPVVGLFMTGATSPRYRGKLDRIAKSHRRASKYTTTAVARFHGLAAHDTPPPALAFTYHIEMTNNSYWNLGTLHIQNTRSTHCTTPPEVGSVRKRRKADRRRRQILPPGVCVWWWCARTTLDASDPV